MAAFRTAITSLIDREREQATPDGEVTARLRTARSAAAMLVAAITVSLVASSVAAANDASLGTTVHRWSRTIGADARSVSLAAKRHHDRQMAVSAVRFRKDALRARKAIAAQPASSDPGRREKDFALRAYSNYARAGSRWAGSAHAALEGRSTAARALARSARTYARTGNRLLIAAGTLLP